MLEAGLRPVVHDNKVSGSKYGAVQHLHGAEAEKHLLVHRIVNDPTEAGRNLSATISLDHATPPKDVVVLQAEAAPKQVAQNLRLLLQVRNNLLEVF